MQRLCSVHAASMRRLCSVYASSMQTAAMQRLCSVYATSMQRLCNSYAAQYINETKQSKKAAKRSNDTEKQNETANKPPAARDTTERTKTMQRPRSVYAASMQPLCSVYAASMQSLCSLYAASMRGRAPASTEPTNAITAQVASSFLSA